MPKNQLRRASGKRLVFAVDLGGTHLRVALVDDSGKILQHLKQETPRGDSAGEIIDALVSAAEKWDCDKLPSLTNFPLKAELQNRLGWPVFLENDANAAAVGEMWLGAARGCCDVVSVTLGTGVGGGVILNGRLWRGSHGSAGEIGHTTVDPFSGLKCKCGNTGCLELFASATAIVRMARELGMNESSAEKVYEAGRRGDELALSVFNKFGMYLGIGLANLINLIDPQVIVITGGAVNGWDLFSDEMYRQVHERAFRATAQQVRIARAECGDNAGLLGATRIALQDLHDFS
jgi:glucokinase